MPINKLFRRAAAAAAAAGAGVVAAAVLLLAVGMARAAPLSATLTVGVDCASIQACLDAAAPGDSVYIPAGVYTESLTLNKAVSLTGELSATTSIQAVAGQRVITVTGIGVDPTYLSGLTLSGGQAQDEPIGLGGGIHLSGTHLILDDIVISGNMADGGGGVFVYDALLEFNSGEIISNTAGVGGGGGLAVVSGQVVINGGRIAGNSGLVGGGLVLNTGAVILNHGEIVSNTAGAMGGGLAMGNGGGVLTQTGGLIAYNMAPNGGGVAVHEGSAAFTGGAVFSNTAEMHGGGLYVYYGRAEMSGGIIASNWAVDGGGVYLGWVSGAFTQSGGSIQSNLAHLGSGLMVWQGSALLTGGQVQSNTVFELESGPVPGKGGGAAVMDGGLTLAGGQILSNTAGDGGGIALMEYTSRYTQTSGLLAYNDAGMYGGGLHIWQGQAELSGGLIAGNSALFGGGVNITSTLTTFTQSGGSIESNLAHLGGGLMVWQGSAFLTGGQVQSNTVYELGFGPVPGKGGGAAVMGGGLTLAGGQILSNTAGEGGGIALVESTSRYTQTGGLIGYNTAYNGGGLALYDGLAVASGGDVLSNTAMVGGGVYLVGGQAAITGVLLGGNAALAAAALYQGAAAGGVLLNAGCIVGNQGISNVLNDGGPLIDATGNWWGAASGPSGAGPGTGDSVSADVDFSGFLAAPNAACPSPPLPAADLRLEKSAAPSTVMPNGLVTYVLTVTNPATSTAASGVSVSDTLPVSITEAPDFSTLPPGHSCETSAAGPPQVVVCQRDAPLAAGDLAVFTLTVRAPLFGGVVLTNSAQVAHAAEDPNPLDNTALITNVVLPGADLEIFKTASPDPVLAGARLTYSLWVENVDGFTADADALTPLRVTDTLPAEATLLAMASSWPGWECAVVGPPAELACTRAISLISGEATPPITIVVTAPVTAMAITNTARVSFAGGAQDPRPDNDLVAVTSHVSAAADLAVSKVGPANAVAGSQYTYQLGVSNDGPSVATGVLLTDALPAGLGYVSAQGDGWLCQYEGPEHRLVCARPGALPAGETTPVVTFTVQAPAASMTITNAASTSASEYDPQPANNSLNGVQTTITNQPPIAHAGPDQAVAVNALVQLDGSLSGDPDGHLPLAYGWEQTGGPAVALAGAGASQPGFTAPATPGVLAFSLVVTDVLGLASLPDSVLITIHHALYLPLVTSAPAADGGLQVTLTSPSAKMSSMVRSNSRAILNASGRLGSYFSVSMAFTVWRETPSRSASSACDHCRSARSSRRLFFTGISGLPGLSPGPTASP